MLSDPTLLSTSPVLAHSKLLGWQDGGLNSYELLHTVFIENFFPVSDLLGGGSLEQLGYGLSVLPPKVAA